MQVVTMIVLVYLIQNPAGLGKLCHPVYTMPVRNSAGIRSTRFETVHTTHDTSRY